MIIRILGHGQWVMEPEQLITLNDADEAVEKAVQDNDQEALHVALSQLVAGVRSFGTEVPDEVIAESDLVLPDEDATIEQVKALLDSITEYYGLIPDAGNFEDEVDSVHATDVEPGLSPQSGMTRHEEDQLATQREEKMSEEDKLQHTEQDAQRPSQDAGGMLGQPAPAEDSTAPQMTQAQAEREEQDLQPAPGQDYGAADEVQVEQGVDGESGEVSEAAGVDPTYDGAPTYPGAPTEEATPQVEYPDDRFTRTDRL